MHFYANICRVYGVYVKSRARLRHVPNLALSSTLPLSSPSPPQSTEVPSDEDASQSESEADSPHRAWRLREAPRRANPFNPQGAAGLEAAAAALPFPAHDAPPAIGHGAAAAAAAAAPQAPARNVRREIKTRAKPRPRSDNPGPKVMKRKFLSGRLYMNMASNGDALTEENAKLEYDLFAMRA